MDEAGRKNWTRLQFRISSTSVPSGFGTHVRRFWIKIAAILVLGLLGGSILTYYWAGNGLHTEQIVFETPRG